VSRERRESLREEEYVLSLSLKTATESLLRTVCGSEFQTAGAEHRKAFFANVVVVKADTLRSNSKQYGGIHVVSPEEEKEGCGGKDLQKRKVLSLE